MARAELPKILAVFREALRVPADISDENLMLFTVSELGLRSAKTAHLVCKFFEAGIILKIFILDSGMTVGEFLDNVCENQIDQ